MTLRACAAEDRPPSAKEAASFKSLGLVYGGAEQEAYSLHLRVSGAGVAPTDLASLAALAQQVGNGSVEIHAPDRLILRGVRVIAAAEALESAWALGFSSHPAIGGPEAVNFAHRVLSFRFEELAAELCVKEAAPLSLAALLLRCASG